MSKQTQFTEENLRELRFRIQQAELETEKRKVKAGKKAARKRWKHKHNAAHNLNRSNIERLQEQAQITREHHAKWLFDPNQKGTSMAVCANITDEAKEFMRLIVERGC